MDPETVRKITRDVMHVVILLVLVFILLYVLTWSNVIKCKRIPFWCDVYYMVKGKPKVLIVYGEDGLGDPNLLRQELANPRHAGVRAAMIRLDRVQLGNLKDYDLVIVTRARTMETAKVKMFIDYVVGGGNLVWTGDAGTKLVDENAYLYKDEKGDVNAPHEPISPWERKLGDTMVLLDELLGVDYVGNYCELVNCIKDREICPATLAPSTNEHPLAYALKPNLPLCVMAGQDFAVVQPISKGTTTIVLSADLGAALHVEGETYGKNVPLILTNAKSSFLGIRIGENVAYYALPPEYYANPKLKEEHQYRSLIENLYYGMLYGRAG
jgi:hypothetical protein